MAVENGRVDPDDEDIFDELDMNDFDSDEPEFTRIPDHLRGLYEAVQLNDQNRFCDVINNCDGNIDDTTGDGDTILHLTCLYGQRLAVQALLERGANMEVKDEDGGIPLHDACAGGYIEIVQLLFNHANDPEVVRRMLETADVEGDTPLHHAARGQHVDVIRLLLAYGASPTKRNAYEKSPSELADPDNEARRVLEQAAAGV